MFVAIFNIEIVRPRWGRMFCSIQFLYTLNPFGILKHQIIERPYKLPSRYEDALASDGGIVGAQPSLPIGWRAEEGWRLPDSEVTVLGRPHDEVYNFQHRVQYYYIFVVLMYIFLNYDHRRKEFKLY